MAQCKDILKLLDELAPIATAQSWDNPGLLVGRESREIDKIVAAMDLTPQVADEAIRTGTQMILLHHPVLFSGTKQVTDKTAEGSMLLQLIRNDICVVAMHTNWDKAKGGVNDALAELLGMTGCVPLLLDPPSLYSLVTYVPNENAAQVIVAVCGAGAGRLGNYENCVFASEGEGQFLPLHGADPFIGEVGKTEHVSEVKLEWVVGKQHLNGVLAALKQSHPYEEPAFSVIALKNKSQSGIGWVGSLNKAVPFGELCGLVSDKLQTVVKGCGDDMAVISRVAVCGGAGGMESIQEALQKGAQALVSSDFKHHELLYACHNGLCVADAGHGPSETPGLYNLIAALQKRLDAVQLNVNVLKTNTESGIRFYGRAFVR